MIQAKRYSRIVGLEAVNALAVDHHVVVRQASYDLPSRNGHRDPHIARRGAPDRTDHHGCRRSNVAVATVEEHGGTLVVAPFTIPGVGRGCYFIDPTGLLVGLHHYDPDAR